MGSLRASMRAMCIQHPLLTLWWTVLRGPAAVACEGFYLRNCYEQHLRWNRCGCVMLL